MPEVERSIKIEESWFNALEKEFNSDYFKKLREFLIKDREEHTVYPPGPRIFAAFDHCPIDRIKVVIIGQDPYHGPGQANGLCFSVADGVRHPKSLINIYKEISRDLGVPYPTSGNLEPWADQGVFLLNATLTVRRSAAGSHQGRGWEQFTDAVIKVLNERCEGLVFLLWGKFAQAKAAIIDEQRHHVLKTTHPSPFSAHYGFMGCGHFSKCNELLAAHGKEPIQWAIS